ncbi:hypothetical protein BDQ17DRAFT_1368804 [Cyathus striatus]|nr:hypothetical protein BDQ17DRAFT_1368804 [Cyathus striatus]
MKSLRWDWGRGRMLVHLLPLCNTIPTRSPLPRPEYPGSHPLRTSFIVDEPSSTRRVVIYVLENVGAEGLGRERGELWTMH